MGFNYSEMDFIREHLGKEIEKIREDYGFDAPKKIVNAISNFVSYYESRTPRESFIEYKKMIKGLEKYFKEDLKVITLHETLLSGFDIEEILRNRKNGELEELKNYLQRLA
jgi:hypothetical protein